jgi:pentatricopeptide repeat domain-containing protein 1
MHLDTALALMEEMRSRNIQPNTHTYSSLLNVCVKAGQLNMALGVYNEVRGPAGLGRLPRELLRAV